MNIHICSLLSDPAWWNPFGFTAAAILQEYFRPIAAMANAPTVATVLMPQPSNVNPEDLLVYVVSRSSSFTSLIAHKSNLWTNNPNHGGSTLALTNENNAIISEVYWDRIQGNPDAPHLLANIIFHEFMHNKLDAIEHPGVDWVHNQCGGGLAKRDHIAAADRPNQVNIARMAAALGTRHLQYTGYLKASDIPPAPRL